MNTNTRNLIILGVIALVIGGAAGFFGSIQYQKGQFQTRIGAFANGNFTGNGMMRRGNTANGTAVRGQVLSVNGNSVTVKLQDGSSKIVILGSSTNIGKSTTASVGDITTGSSVTVFGTTNSDGSVTATNVQIGNEAFGGPRGAGSPMPAQTSAPAGY